jgi:GNAT superfamily N-acetyltransferase
MITLLRTNATDHRFIKLVTQLDAYLAHIDGKDHAFYAQFNKVDNLKYVVLLMEDEEAVCCGAIKEYAPETMEVKRMFTLPEKRGKGYAKQVLEELEQWAREIGYLKCVLETGKKQTEAITLYQHIGYKQIPNFGQYAHVDNSVCFEKEL